MSLATDLRFALAPATSSPRAKGLPRRLTFGDELMARQYREAVARHLGALATLREALRSSGAEHRAQCRAAVASTRAHAWEVYRAAAEGSRRKRRGAVQSAKDLECGAGPAGARREIKGTLTKSLCDDRCTGARGNKCSCSCGGKNHGIDS
jgi:hypothetical protein